jgi:hypothetical protein
MLLIVNPRLFLSLRRLSSSTLLFVFMKPILGSPENLSLLTTGLAYSSVINRVGIFWREFVSALAVCQTAKVVVLSFWEHADAYMRWMIDYLQMCRVTAQTISAQMMNLQSFRYRTHQKFVNMAMYKNPFAVYQDNSIPSDGVGASPCPTFQFVCAKTFLNT